MASQLTDPLAPPQPPDLGTYTGALQLPQAMTQPMAPQPAMAPQPTMGPPMALPQTIASQFVGQQFVGQQPAQFTKAPVSAPPQRDPNPHPRNVYAASLPNDFTQQELVALFSPFGQIESARIVARNPHPPGRRAYAFVLFVNEVGAAASVRALQTATVRGQRIQVRLSRNRDVGENYFAPTPGAIQAGTPVAPATTTAPLPNVVYAQPTSVVVPPGPQPGPYYVSQGSAPPQPAQWGASTSTAPSTAPNVVYLTGQQQAPPPPPPGTSAAPPAMYMMPMQGQVGGQPPQATTSFSGLAQVDR